MLVTQICPFRGVYTCFESFLPSTSKFGMLYTLCSKWTKSLKEIFERNGYLTPFIDKCFKKFLGMSHITKATLSTMEKEPSLQSEDFFTSQNWNKKWYERQFQFL